MVWVLTVLILVVISTIYINSLINRNKPYKRIKKFKIIRKKKNKNSSNNTEKEETSTELLEPNQNREYYYNDSRELYYLNETEQFYDNSVCSRQNQNQTNIKQGVDDSGSYYYENTLPL